MKKNCLLGWCTINAARWKDAFDIFPVVIMTLHNRYDNSNIEYKKNLEQLPILNFLSLFQWIGW